MTPRRMPMATACIRAFAPSLFMMCLMWTFTVCSEIKRHLPISRFRFPWAIRCRTSTSRSVSESLLRCSARVCATAFGRCLRPECTLRNVPVECREHDEAGFREVGSNRGHGADPGHVREFQIHQRNIRLQLPEFVDGFLCSRRHRHELHVLWTFGRACSSIRTGGRR
jgi:hypothetical protein